MVDFVWWKPDHGLHFPGNDAVLYVALNLSFVVLAYSIERPHGSLIFVYVYVWEAVADTCVVLEHVMIIFWRH